MGFICLYTLDTLVPSCRWSLETCDITRPASIKDNQAWAVVPDAAAVDVVVEEPRGEVDEMGGQ